MVVTLFIFVLIFVLGFILTNTISTKLTLGEKVGLAFPFGFALLSFVMVFYSFITVPFTLSLVLITSSVLAIISLAILWKQGNLKRIIHFDTYPIQKLKSINLSWIFLAGLVVYIVYAMAAKAMFWPTAAYDSITGYDYMAKVVAAEGTYNNSIFDVENPTAGIRHSYPPFVNSSFAVAYMAGLNSTKIIVVLLFISLAIYFWSVFRKYTTETAAIFFTLLLVAVPEFLAMASLSLTNVPQTLFAAAGLIAIFEFIQKRDSSYLILGAVLVGLNVWTRSDGVIFIVGGGLMLLIDGFRNHRMKIANYWKPLVLFGAISATPFIIWQAYSKFYIKNVYSSSDAFVKHLFWDSDKFTDLVSQVYTILESTQLYGAIFIIFVIVIIANIRNIIKTKPIMLISILISFALYFMLYYQMNNGGDGFAYSVQSMVRSSFKRGMFPFLPMVCFYMATTPMVNKFFNWIFKPIFK
ncbi:MAG: glycosyltransferase family 39 protein [Bacteroidia bacterium]|nr:glycosyltransferase family 39 protein [Bacteroidia bacterium]